MRAITGYDRVMVYKFDEEGHGEVLSEERRPDLESYLGNRYPASDIPQIARRLYVRNRVRVLADVNYAPVPLQPRLSPISGQELDMSLCHLRSISPLHVQYLQNMGVAATLVASLLVGGQLWGLISCHHYVPRTVPSEMRTVCELLAETVGTRILALESFVQGQAEIAVRRLEQRLIEAIGRKGDWRAALFGGGKALLHPLEATGAALLFEGETLTVGEVPGTRPLLDIGAWLDTLPPAPVHSTASIGRAEPRFASFAATASGLVAARISEAPGEYLLWFRPERVRTVTWGGNPLKPVLVGNNPRDLSPRRSFAQWHQLVETTADPWTTDDLTAARLIGETVSDVVVQVRAVRTLIVQNQLAHVRQQVGLADQPVVIADSSGRIILTNEAFERLFPPVHRELQHLGDLPDCFAEPAEMRARLHALLVERRTWRGEALLNLGSGVAHPLMVRADPVFSSPGQVLGFVLLFTDLTEKQSARQARQRFQEGVFAELHRGARRLDEPADLLFQQLFSAVVDNAQVAALEIADGVDVAHVPDMLDSVQASITRAALLVEQFVGLSAKDAGRTRRRPTLRQR